MSKKRPNKKLSPYEQRKKRPYVYSDALNNFLAIVRGESKGNLNHARDMHDDFLLRINAWSEWPGSRIRGREIGT